MPKVKSRDCLFCVIDKKEKPLFKTKNFLFLKSKYGICPHHYLLISREHFREEREMNDDLWREYKEMCDKAFEHVRTQTDNKPLTFINPPHMQSIPHFHRHFVDGIFGVLGVEKALKSYLYLKEEIFKQSPKK